MEQTSEDEIYNDRQVAKILFKDTLKPNSWKTIQKMARQGLIRGQKIGRGWRFHKDAVKDFLLRKGHR
jgi:excisionase family DNA binding protein